MKKEHIIKIVSFKTGEDPEVGSIENSVEGIRKAIGGGYFQVINIGIKGMVVICDEEGLIKELPYNRGLRGDWLIAGSKGDEFISLTEKQIDWIRKNIKHVHI